MLVWGVLLPDASLLACDAHRHWIQGPHVGCHISTFAVCLSNFSYEVTSCTLLSTVGQPILAITLSISILWVEPRCSVQRHTQTSRTRASLKPNQSPHTQHDSDQMDARAVLGMMFGKVRLCFKCHGIMTYHPKRSAHCALGRRCGTPDPPPSTDPFPAFLAT